MTRLTLHFNYIKDFYATVNAVLPTKPSHSALENVYFQFFDGYKVVTATDTVNYCRVVVQGNFAASDITYTATKKQIAEAKSLKIDLNLCEADPDYAFLVTPPSVEGTTFSIAAQSLISASQFASKDQYRQILTGIHFNGTSLYATDHHTLYQEKVEYKGDAFTLDAHHKLFDKKFLTGTCEITVGSEYASIASGNVSLYIRLLDGSFPACDRLLSGYNLATMDSLEVSESVVKLTKNVKTWVRFSEDGDISFNRQDGEYASLGNAGAKLTDSLLFNATYLNRALNAWVKPSGLTLKYRNRRSAVFLQDASGDRTVVVMPIDHRN